MRTLRTILIGSFLACACAVIPVSGAVIMKSGTGNDLNDGASWVGTAAPTSSDVATWTNSSLGAGLTLGTAASWNGITVSGATSDIGISGAGGLTLGAGGISLYNSPVSLFLSNSVALGANQSWLVSGGKALTMAGNVSGGYGLGVGGLAYPAFLPSSATTIFYNASLANVVNAGGTMGGAYVNSGVPMAATAYFFTNNGTTATYQMQVSDGGYIKCVKVQLQQSGANITGYVVYAKYTTGSLGYNFDAGGNAGTIATSSGAGGYGSASTLLSLGSPAYASYLPATPTTVIAFTNALLSSVTSAGGTMGGGYVAGGPVATTTYFFNNNGTTATYQMQAYNSGYTKSVKVQLSQSGPDIVATVLYARYDTSGASTLGQNFDVVGGNIAEGTIATSAAAGGYGAASVSIVAGGGTVTLLGANTYSGITTIGAGTLVVGGAGSLGNGAYSATMLNNSALVFASSATQILSGVISGSGSLTQSGPGMLTLSAVNTYKGNVTVNGGTLRSIAGNNGGTTALGQNNLVTVNAGAVLDVGGTNGSTAQLGVSELNTLTINGGTLNFSLYGTGGQNGPYLGTMNLTNATITATTTSGPRWGYTHPSGIINIGGVSTWSAPAWLVNASGKSLTINGDGDLVISGVIADFPGIGGLPFIKNGTGKLILSGANTYTGSNIVNNGLLRLVNPSTYASAGIALAAPSVLELSNTVAVTLTNGINGTGAVRKNGPGSMVLAVNNTYGGATTVDAGKLYVNVALNAASVVSVGTGATFGGRGSAGAVTVADGGSIEGGQGGSGALTLASLTFNGSGGLGVVVAAGTTPLVISGTLTTGPSAANPIIINVLNGSQPAPGTYHIAQWGTLAGNAGFALPPNRIYSLQTNGNYLDLVVSATTDYPIWSGLYGSEWSMNAIPSPKNWKLSSDGSGTDFMSSDNVLMDDSAAGTTLIDISVADVSPALVTVSNSLLSYTIQGTRGVAAGSLLKLGSGLLTISNANTYVAGTVISNGAIAFVNGGLGSAGTIRFGGNSTLRWLGHNQDISSRLAIDNGITAIIDTMYNPVVFASAFGGGASGSIVKTGSGSLTLSGANTFTGPAIVSQGTLYCGNGAALGTAPATLGDASSGAADALLLASTPVTIGNGIVVSSQLGGTAVIGSANYTAAANTHFGGTITLNRAVTLQAGSSDRTTFGNTITGTGDVNISSPFASNRRIVFQRTSGSPNDFIGNIYIGANADLQIGVADGIGNRTVPDTAAIYLASGARFRIAPTGSGDAETIGTLNSLTAGAGTVDLFTGASFILTVGGDNANGAFSGVITNTAGSLSLVKVGTGIQELAGTGIAYSGLTLVTNGTLRLNNCAAFASTNIVVVSNAAFGGWANIRGTVNVQPGATFQPGLGGTDTSTLVITNTVSLAGTNIFVLNRTNAQNSSRVMGVSSLTISGPLHVINAGPALQEGDTFVLIGASSRTGNFSETNLPALDGGLVWVTPDNYSTLMVMATVPPVFTVNPASRIALAGSTVTFTALAVGAPTVTYQWLSNDVPVVDATNTSFQVPNVQAGSVALYSAVASNPFGSRTSAVASVTVSVGNVLPTVIGADAPAGYWRLGESNGPIAFDMTAAHDGGYSNNVTLGVAGALTGDPDTAARFDGVSNKVDVPYSSALNTPSFTFECWARVTGGDGTYRSPLTSREDLPQRGFIIYAAPNNTWQFWSGSGAQTGWDGDGGTGVPVVNNTWVHLAGTYDGVTKRFYVNGLQVSSTNVTIAPNGSKPLRIGAGSTDLITGNYYFPGDVDEVAVFPAALGPDRIAAHFAAAKGRFTNQPPVAVNDEAGLIQGRTLSLSATKLLANDTDPNGDTLSIVSVSSTSTNGFPVSYSAGVITFTPAASFQGTDLFTYVITDGYAATATGSVTVTVISSNAPSPNVVFGPVISNGSFLVRFAGIPGLGYTVESSDVMPATNWVKVINVTAPSVGVFEFSEPTGGATQRFYRTVYPAYQ